MIVRSILLIASLILPAIAQTESPPKKSDKDIQVRLLAEQFPPELGKVVFQFEKTQSDAVELPTNRLSDPVAVPVRSMNLRLLDKPVALCQITLPEEGKAFAVILVTAKPSGFKPIVVRTDDPSFKAGDVLFINRSEKTILGKLGTTPLVLKPNETAKSRPTGAVENTYYDIAFAIREQAGDKLVSSSRWPVENDLRSYLFFFTNAEGRTTFRSVDEYLEVRKSQ
jgi:hypothetical protein